MVLAFDEETHAHGSEASPSPAGPAGPAPPGGTHGSLSHGCRRMFPVCPQSALF